MKKIAVAAKTNIKKWQWKLLIAFTVVILLALSPLFITANKQDRNDNFRVLISEKADFIYLANLSETLNLLKDTAVFQQITQRPLEVKLVDVLENDPVFGPTRAEYQKKTNTILIYSQPWPRQEIEDLDLIRIYLHEIGHAWFNFADGETQQSYRQFVLDNRNIEESPDFVASVILETESINTEKPDKIDNMLIIRAVNEDFAESFALYFQAPQILERFYPKRFSWFSVEFGQ